MVMLRATKEWHDTTTQEQSTSVEKAFEAFLSATRPPVANISPRAQLFEEM